jgi:hypothetical protein
LIDIGEVKKINIAMVVPNVYAFAIIAQAFADFDKNAAQMFKVLNEF